MLGQKCWKKLKIILIPFTKKSTVIFNIIVSYSQLYQSNEFIIYYLFGNFHKI